MREKKEKSVVYRDIVIDGVITYGESEVKDLLQRIKSLTESGAEMGNVITSMTSQLGGYKASNAQYKKANVGLKEKNRKLHQLNKEGDELNEKRIAEIDSLNKQIDKFVLQVSDLTDEVNQLKKDRKVISEALNQVYGERDQYKANYEHVLSLPWYKRMLLRKPNKQQ